MNIFIQSKEIIFSCSMCGSCCTQLKEFFGLYDFLDRGDGQCYHFNENTNTCTIYNNRPKLCQVEYGYENFKAIMTYSEYIAKTKEACLYLQRIKFNGKKYEK